MRQPSNLRNTAVSATGNVEKSHVQNHCLHNACTLGLERIHVCIYMIHNVSTYMYQSSFFFAFPGVYLCLCLLVMYMCRLYYCITMQYMFYIFRPKHPVKIHVWAGISWRGASGTIIFDGIMIAELYVRILEVALSPSAQTLYP